MELEKGDNNTKSFTNLDERSCGSNEACGSYIDGLSTTASLVNTDQRCCLELCFVLFRNAKLHIEATLRRDRWKTKWIDSNRP